VACSISVVGLRLVSAHMAKAVSWGSKTLHKIITHEEASHRLVCFLLSYKIGCPTSLALFQDLGLHIKVSHYLFRDLFFCTILVALQVLGVEWKDSGNRYISKKGVQGIWRMGDVTLTNLSAAVDFRTPPADQATRCHIKAAT
jgi:hypothetical protein